jgi:hypothetical protein
MLDSFSRNDSASSLASWSSCMDARDLAAKHLDDVRAKMRELKALERSLVSFVEACDTSCAGGPGPDCVILGDLGKHCGCGSSSL